MVVWTHVLLAGVWGGLLALERRAFLQAMFSRPLVAATGMGLLLEDLPSGLFIGMLLELFYLGAATLGAALPENDTLAATSAAAAGSAMANASGGGGTPAMWSLAILLFIGTGRVGRLIDRSLEQYSARLASKAMASAEAGQLTRAVRQNLWGMWPHFLSFGAISAASAALGYLLWPSLQRLPLPAVRGLAWAYPAMASVAAAIAVRGSHSRKAALYAGAAAAAVTLWVAASSLFGGPL
ncbi:MAG: PTS sugar transporter subunit IIC [Myxococcales bacterium]|nr:PTS sugar transporter subunit IIC [Myxococcales bacterium]